MCRTLILFFLLVAFHSKAQYVTIPDDNLRTALEAYFPQCFTNGLLDTLIAESLTETGVGIEGLDIRSLEGMQYFKSFTSLYCGYNMLTDLRFLPPDLTWLTAPGNQITTVDSLPRNLIYLDLNYNDLASLSRLPASLKILSVSHNPDLTCLPLLPSGLEELYLYNTAVQCIPNKPDKLASRQLFSLCNPVNNRHQCRSLPLISGKVFVDINKNGLQDPGELYRKGIKVMIASEGLYTFSDDSGYYAISVPRSGAYEISVSNPYYSGLPHIVQTSTGQAGYRDIALQTELEERDFAVTVMNYNFARPGFDMVFRIELDNIGSEAGSAEVFFRLPSLYTIDSSSASGTIHSGAISWNFSNLLPGERRIIMVYGKLDASAVLGEVLNISVLVNPDDTEDHNAENNVATLHLIIQGAYDPNDKQGPDKMTPDQISAGEYLYYTIRFQNTGTDTAFAVIISDQLDLKLQAGTVELLSSSHNCRVEAMDEQLYFVLENILLPDSTTNLAASCGYVYFRVQPLTTLAEGEEISNYAEIYFDYNTPITTNTIQTLIERDVITSLFSGERSPVSLTAYPNPVTSGVVHISKGVHYRILNHQGISVAEGMSDSTPIVLYHLPPGLYVVEMNVGEIRKTTKMVVSN